MFCIGIIETQKHENTQEIQLRTEVLKQANIKNCWRKELGAKSEKKLLKT